MRAGGLDEESFLTLQQDTREHTVSRSRAGAAGGSPDAAGSS